MFLGLKMTGFKEGFISTVLNTAKPRNITLGQMLGNGRLKKNVQLFLLPFQNSSAAELSYFMLKPYCN